MLLVKVEDLDLTDENYDPLANWTTKRLLAEIQDNFAKEDEYSQALAYTLWQRDELPDQFDVFEFEDEADRESEFVFEVENGYLINPKNEVFYCGKFLFKETEWDKIIKRVSEHMDQEEYWPSIVLAGERGGYNFVDITSG